MRGRRFLHLTTLQDGSAPQQNTAQNIHLQILQICDENP